MSASGPDSRETPNGGDPRRQVWRELAAAVAGGSLLATTQALAFALGSVAEWGRGGWLDWLALVGLIPLVGRLRLTTPRRAFGLGAVAGCAYFALTLFWVALVMTTHGRIPHIGAIPILMLLVGFLSLFWALALWAAVRIRDRLGVAVVWSLPVVWVALEFLRNYTLTGFPWANVGYSQVRSLWLAQLASLGGVYLVAFSVVWTNALGEALWARVRHSVRLPHAALVAWAAFMTLAALWAVVRLVGDPAPEAAPLLRAAVVQGNLDERVRLAGWRDQRWVLERMLAESRRAALEGVELTVWPEGSLPGPVRHDVASLAYAAGHPEPLTSGLVVGAIGQSRVDGRVRQTNSAFVTDERLHILGRYDKRHLVPFGEYVPLASLLPYEWFVPARAVFFSPGPGHRPVDTPWGQLGVLICYEAIFPEIAREAVDQGAQLLVNVTNDSWFGASAAPYQHLVMSRMRSIETGRYQLRAANTGVSAIVDSRGRELARLGLGLVDGGRDRLDRDALRPAAHLTGEVALLDDTTPYNVTGDLFAWLCSLASVIGLAATWFGRRAITSWLVDS